MWFRPPYKGADVEAGGVRPLYPTMMEPPELRWAFIRKIYSILAIQMLLTVAIAAIVVSVRPVAEFFVSSGAGLGLYIFLVILPFIVLCPLYYYYQQHPVNYLLLGIFTVSISFAVGLTCAFTKGEIILESAILTAVVVISLTLYTFWAASRGHDFNFLGPFLFAAVMILMPFLQQWWRSGHGYKASSGCGFTTTERRCSACREAESGGRSRWEEPAGSWRYWQSCEP